jgi:hypothetical protein
MTQKDAKEWAAPDSMGVSVTRSAPAGSTFAAENGNGDETSVERPFERNETPSLMRLYRTIMDMSRKGPLPRPLARILVKLMSELLTRGEKL